MCGNERGLREEALFYLQNRQHLYKKLSAKKQKNIQKSRSLERERRPLSGFTLHRDRATAKSSKLSDQAVSDRGLGSGPGSLFIVFHLLDVLIPVPGYLAAGGPKLNILFVDLDILI